MRAGFHKALMTRSSRHDADARNTRQLASFRHFQVGMLQLIATTITSRRKRHVKNKLRRRLQAALYLIMPMMPI